MAHSVADASGRFLRTLNLGPFNPLLRPHHQHCPVSKARFQMRRAQECPLAADCMADEPRFGSRRALSRRGGWPAWRRTRKPRVDWPLQRGPAILEPRPNGSKAQIAVSGCRVVGQFRQMLALDGSVLAMLDSETRSPQY